MLCDVRQAEWVHVENGYLFRVKADRFLRNMVRAIVGTSIRIGKGYKPVAHMAEVIAAPQEPLQAILDEISPRSPHRLTEAPRMTDLTGLGAFLRGLRDLGMPPVATGDIPADPPAPANPHSAPRPRLVG